MRLSGFRTYFVMLTFERLGALRDRSLERLRLRPGLTSRPGLTGAIPLSVSGKTTVEPEGSSSERFNWL